MEPTDQSPLSGTNRQKPSVDCREPEADILEWGTKVSAGGYGISFKPCQPPNTGGIERQAVPGFIVFVT